MTQSLRRSLLLTVAIIVALGLGTVIFAVLRAASTNLEERAQGELSVANRVFDKLLAERYEQLAGHAVLLADDLRFKQAIAKHAITRSDQDIIALLQSHQQSIGADLSLLVDAQGRVISSTAAASFSGSLFESLHSERPAQLKTITIVNGRPYQLVFAPVTAANWIAWIGMGFELDQEVLVTLHDVTGMQSSLIFSRGEETLGFLSTLPDSLQALLPASDHLSQASARFTRRLQAHDWLSTAAKLDAGGDELELLLLLSTSVSDEKLAYEALRGQLLTLGLLVLLLAAAVAFWYSGRASHSIRHLAMAAQRIAHGDYSRKLALADNDALSALEQAFNDMQRAIEQRENRYSFQARHDPSTGVANRHHFDEWLKSQLTGDEHCALVLLQVCGMSQLNDIYGPEVANNLIRDVAERARSLLGPQDMIARFESDQFCLYLRGVDQDQVAALEDRLTSAFAKPFYRGELELKLEVHFGMALCPEHGSDYADLLRRSNIALSQTFANRSLFELYQSGQDALHLRKIQITHSLPDALASDAFRMLVQPQLNLSKGRIERAEALLRWPDPTLGMVYPDEFIPLAERCGQIGNISNWLVEHAIGQLTRWQELGVKVSLSINISAHDLLKDSFVDHVARTLAAHQIPASALVLEVTESAVIEHPQQAIRNLQQLHDLGICIAMDDFGTGFSSLSQLKALPIHEVKIDKSFILNLDKDEDDQKIVQAAIQMAHNLDLLVVAEGVENQASLAMLQEMNCDLIQGNYLAKAMPSEELPHWLQAAGSDKLVFLSEFRQRNLK